VKYVVVDTDVFSLLFRGQDVDLYRPTLMARFQFCPSYL
jgi:hypothetical protein